MTMILLACLVCSIMVFSLVVPFSTRFHVFMFFDMQEKTNEDIPMPSYFRFLALLAFKIFAAEQV